MSQADKAREFHDLHRRGDPLVLYNVWDAASARTVRDAGARAIATGSWSVAAAQGYADGEAIPFELVATIVSRIVATVDVPVTVDFEGGYAGDPVAIADNAARLIGLGIVGLNFEDQVVGEDRLYTVDEQCRRIAAIRGAAQRIGPPVFINARTDLFLQASDPAMHASLVDDALARAVAYAEAGADGFFVPGLSAAALIARVCDASPLPVNVMMTPRVPARARLAALGVARISYGPGPLVETMAALGTRARAVLASDSSVT